MKWWSQSNGMRPRSRGKHEMVVLKQRNETTIEGKA
ncbi:hypothetical protein JOC95_000476 [Bacillus tianshenii]|uniref:Uncharacterized protein n=1 Tax=Sutcliffiella tianshenii TaxID=1463404 RepID=A0ABS2NVG0_9BACI|nr:hypothetical protein [Bacillus tianshenii]